MRSGSYGPPGATPPPTVTVATWTPAGPYSLASSLVSARAAALPRDRLVTAGSGSGIPPVITIVPPPAPAMAGARCTAAVRAPRTLIAYAREVLLAAQL